MVRRLLLITIGVDHAALPAETLIVSPSLALLTHEATLARSGVLDQVGLPPVHAAMADESAQGAQSPNVKSANINLILVMSQRTSRSRNATLEQGR